MKTLWVIVLAVFGLTACGEDTPVDLNAPTTDEKDTLTLAFLNNMPMKSGSAIDCKTTQIGKRYYAGCAVISIGNRGNTYIFLYNKDKDPVKRFYALNGSAMSKYDTYFRSEKLLGNYKDAFGLPMEKDIDLGAVHKAFDK